MQAQAESKAVTEQELLEAQQRRVVQLYAEVKKLEAQAEKLKGEAKPLAEALYKDHGLAVLSGDAGVVTVTEKAGAKRFDRKRAETFLTAAQIAACLVEGKPTITVSFKAREG